MDDTGRVDIFQASLYLKTHTLAAVALPSAVYGGMLIASRYKRNAKRISCVIAYHDLVEEVLDELFLERSGG